MNCLYCQHQLRLIVGGKIKHWRCLFCPETNFYSHESKDEIRQVNLYFSHRGVRYVYVEVYDPVWQKRNGFVAFFKPVASFHMIVEFKTMPNINPLNVFKKFLTYNTFS